MGREAALFRSVLPGLVEKGIQGGFVCHRGKIWKDLCVGGCCGTPRLSVQADRKAVLAHATRPRAAACER